MKERTIARLEKIYGPRTLEPATHDKEEEEDELAQDLDLNPPVKPKEKTRHKRNAPRPFLFLPVLLIRRGD